MAPPKREVVTVTLAGAGTVRLVVPELSWLRLKPTPTAELYVVSAVTYPEAQRAELPNAGLQPVVLQVGTIQVVALDWSLFQVKP